MYLAQRPFGFAHEKFRLNHTLAHNQKQWTQNGFDAVRQSNSRWYEAHWSALNKTRRAWNQNWNHLFRQKILCTHDCEYIQRPNNYCSIVYALRNRLPPPSLATCFFFFSFSKMLLCVWAPVVQCTARWTTVVAAHLLHRNAWTPNKSHRSLFFGWKTWHEKSSGAERQGERDWERLREVGNGLTLSRNDQSRYTLYIDCSAERAFAQFGVWVRGAFEQPQAVQRTYVSGDLL